MCRRCGLLQGQQSRTRRVRKRDRAPGKVSKGRSGRPIGSVRKANCREIGKMVEPGETRFEPDNSLQAGASRRDRRNSALAFGHARTTIGRFEA